jgi:hypothetical protein
MLLQWELTNLKVEEGTRLAEPALWIWREEPRRGDY